MQTLYIVPSEAGTTVYDLDSRVVGLTRESGEGGKGFYTTGMGSKQFYPTGTLPEQIQERVAVLLLTRPGTMLPGIGAWVTQEHLWVYVDEGTV